MNAGFTYLISISLFTVVSANVTDDDMLLYWRKSGDSKCEPFTTFLISCNKCVCSADGTSFCTRMACFKAPMFLTDISGNITPVNDLNRADEDEYGRPSDSV